MSTIKLCALFVPTEKDPAFCQCRAHWVHHSLAARRFFFDCKDGALIAKVINACKRDNASPCPKYTPKADWESGCPAPDCECGRPRESHPADQVLSGIRAFREAHTPKTKEPCGHFYGTPSNPGTCSICSCKWVQHAPTNRGLVVEAFEDIHAGYCKSIIMNGDIECSCMTNIEKQAALDKLAKPATAVKHCKHFASKSIGVTICACGTPFHEHTQEARDGYHTFGVWRSAHLGNYELIRWFLSLEGNNREQRITTLKRLLADPYASHTGTDGIPMPDGTTLQAMLDALTGSHHIKSPKDLTKLTTHFPDDDLIEAVVVHEETAAERVYLCHVCGDLTSMMPGMPCNECSTFLDTHVSGPAVRVSTDKGGS